MGYWDQISRQTKKKYKDSQRPAGATGEPGYGSFGRATAHDVGPGGSQMGMTDFRGTYVNEDPNSWAIHPTHRTQGGSVSTGGKNYAAFAPEEREPGPDLGGSPTTPGGSPTGGGGRRYGGGGGGGGSSAANMAAITRLLGRKPQQHTAMQVPEYQAPEFYDFDDAVYDRARTALTQGIAADRASGAAAYEAARAELAALQSNPYARQGAQQPTRAAGPAAASLGRFGGQVDTSGAAAGNAAFDQVRQLLGGAQQQRQAAEGRALSGDERRFNESLANQGRTMGQGIEMAAARARQQYDQDAWRYGVETADKLYNQRMLQAQADHQASSANVDLANQHSSDSINTLIQLLSSGQKVDPEIIAQFVGEGGS